MTEMSTIVEAECPEDLIDLAVAKMRDEHWSTTAAGHWYADQLRGNAAEFGAAWAESEHHKLACRSAVTDVRYAGKRDELRLSMELAHGTIPAVAEFAGDPNRSLSEFISTPTKDVVTGRILKEQQLTFWRHMSREELSIKLADLRKKSRALIVTIKGYEIFEEAYRQYPDAADLGEACDRAGIDMQAVIRLMDAA